MLYAHGNGFYSPHFPQALNPFYSQGQNPFPGSPFINAPYGVAPSPFVNTPYGVAPQIPGSIQHWMQPLATQQILAQQLAAQLAAQPTAFGGLASNGYGGQPNGLSASPVLQPQWLQQLAQHHQLMAQHLAHLAAQQAVQGHVGSPYFGQFVPGQVGPNFAPSMTLQ